MVILWVIKTIKYANLEFEKYNTWNVKVDCKSSILNKIRTFLETKNLLDNKLVKVLDF